MKFRSKDEEMFNLSWDTSGIPELIGKEVKLKDWSSPIVKVVPKKSWYNTTRYKRP